MIKKHTLYGKILAIVWFMMLCQALYADAAVMPMSSPANIATEDLKIRDLLQQIVDVNQRFKEKFHDVLSHSTLQQQTPFATLVLCSDSRVDTDIVSDTPTGNMFVIRNIGNQLSNALGSVEYGVNYLDTKLLLVVGHSQCGAVKAAMSDYSFKSDHLKAELDTLDVNSKQTLNENIVHNVHHQVENAVKKFQQEVDSGKTVVIGMVYDMHNDFGYGDGQLILVNINNESDPVKLQDSKYVQGLKNLTILKAK